MKRIIKRVIKLVQVAQNVRMLQRMLESGCRFISVSFLAVAETARRRTRAVAVELAIASRGDRGESCRVAELAECEDAVGGHKKAIHGAHNNYLYFHSVCVCVQLIANALHGRKR